jgi:hypothetical protein
VTVPDDREPVTTIMYDLREVTAETSTMTSRIRPSRVAEWAELVDDPVPDVVRDDGERHREESDPDAAARWVATGSAPEGE